MKDKDKYLLDLLKQKKVSLAKTSLDNYHPSLYSKAVAYKVYRAYMREYGRFI